MNRSEQNTIKNEEHYDKVYRNFNVKSILHRVNNLDAFLADATRTDTSWVGLYYDNFQNQLKGKKILELGCGDCTNAAIMAALGAEVYANDISQMSGDIINSLNANHNFEFPLTFIKGDFLKADLTPDFYDIVVGKAFVHHLTHAQEQEFISKIAWILKPDGVVRFFEPAVNSKFLDELRWLTPVPRRPSKLQRKKFKVWKANDPHPERDNSSKHYEAIGRKYFEKVRIVPIGSIERFHRILPKKHNRDFRRWAFRMEKYIPKRLNLSFTRSQMIEYKNPKEGTL